jgi:hypothetical protein
MNHCKELNFEVVAVSDIWKLRREEDAARWKEKMKNDEKAFMLQMNLSNPGLRTLLGNGTPAK